MLGEELGVPQRKVEEHGVAGRIETAGVSAVPRRITQQFLCPIMSRRRRWRGHRPFRRGPVAARRPWLAGCARDRAGRRRTAVVRCPPPRSHAAPDDVACSHRWFHPTPRGVAGSDPHRQPARSSGCCWVPPPPGRPTARALVPGRAEDRWVCQPRVEQIHLQVLQPDRDRPARPQVRTPSPR